MILGIDVGGTHTDAVVLDGVSIKAQTKVPTNHDDLLKSVRAAMKAVLTQVESVRVRQINLSTTLSTNAIVQGKTEPVGMIVSSGPGINPESYRIGSHYHVVEGSIDHRGVKVLDLDKKQLSRALKSCRHLGVSVFAAVTKFSTRNPEHELLIKSTIGPDQDHITLGHSLSGIMNFPRRVATAYFNSSVWRLYGNFSRAVEESVKEFGLEAEINVLKADGGTMPLAKSKDRPVESVLSGPAASVMGIIALCKIKEDAIMLDIGGTTTDVAVFADDSPVIEHQGMVLASYPTLIQALKVRSIGIGGDSTLHFKAGKVTVGPDRQGPCLALRPGKGQGGSAAVPALTDALNVLGLAEFGDREASIEGIGHLARSWGLPPEELSRQAVRYAINQITAAALNLIDDINKKPVYTIREVLEGKLVKPKKVYVMGGPALVLSDRLREAFGLDVVVPEHFALANAIGAALTRTTAEAALFADTKQGKMFISNLDVSKRIPKTYVLDQAKDDARRYLLEHLRSMGVTDSDLDPIITEAESFNVVDGTTTMGRNIRVKCQVRPGVSGWFDHGQSSPDNNH
ncbi:MAG: hydantoinase/oxoprolinase family protein [Deltaproteobacteria bacterium]|nr:hydantoinase/oxoprolinase family protein [Deltaproteobacteria bacterium]